jgi:AcrR family transcriptional regulator
MTARDARLEPRKRPIQARSAETVTAILEAAARILEERGFDGYTTNAIAERAGVSIGSLYQYFPGKDAVTLALAEREAAILLADVAEAGGSDAWRFGLDAMIRAATRHQLSRPRLARLLDFEESRLSARDRQTRGETHIHAALVALLNRRAVPSPDDPSELAFDIIAIARGLVDSAGARGETDGARLERRVARAVFGYLERCGPISRPEPPSC